MIWRTSITDLVEAGSLLPVLAVYNHLRCGVQGMQAGGGVTGGVRGNEKEFGGTGGGKELGIEVQNKKD